MRWTTMLAMGCASSFENLEQATHDAVNQVRAEQGLPALVLEPTLRDTARDHTLDMSLGDVPVGHAGFEERAAAVRLELPVARVGENVAFNRGSEDPVRTAIQGWLESAGHRENLEGDWLYAGVGVAHDSTDGWYFTQIFAE